MAHLARSTRLDDAIEIWQLFVLVVKSKTVNLAVTDALKEIGQRLGGVTLSCSEDEADELLTEDACSEIMVAMPDNDRACSSLCETYRSSPFFQMFDESASKVEIPEGVSGELANPFYVPKVVQYLLRYLLPYFPLWSRYIQCILLPHNENPLSNSPSELGFQQKKSKAKKNQRAPRYLKQALEEEEKKILVHPYPSRFESRKRKVASRGEGPPMKEPHKEKWKKNKNLRLPGGHYSSKQESRYGKKILEKSKKLLLQMTAKRKEGPKHVSKNSNENQVESTASAACNEGSADEVQSPASAVCNESPSNEVESTATAPCNEIPADEVVNIPTVIIPFDHLDYDRDLSDASQIITSEGVVWTKVCDDIFMTTNEKGITVYNSSVGILAGVDLVNLLTEPHQVPMMADSILPDPSSVSNQEANNSVLPNTVEPQSESHHVPMMAVPMFSDSCSVSNQEANNSVLPNSVEPQSEPHRVPMMAVPMLSNSFSVSNQEVNNSVLPNTVEPQSESHRVPMMAVPMFSDSCSVSNQEANYSVLPNSVEPQSEPHRVPMMAVPMFSDSCSVSNQEANNSVQPNSLEPQPESHHVPMMAVPMLSDSCSVSNQEANNSVLPPSVEPQSEPHRAHTMAEPMSPDPLCVSNQEVKNFRPPSIVEPQSESHLVPMMAVPMLPDLSSVSNQEANNSALPNTHTVNVTSKLPLSFPEIPSKFRGNIFGTTLYDSDFESILPKCELFDSVIDSFLLLMKHSTSKAEVLTFPSYLLESISMGLEIKIVREHMFNDLWLIPSHLGRNHWVLYVVFLRKKKIFLLDSLNKSGSLSKEAKERLKILMYVLAESYEAACGSKLSWSSWTFHCPHDVALQKSANDCGVFVCLWSYALCCQVDLLSKQKMTSERVRNWLATVLLTNCKRVEDRVFVVSQKEHVDIMYKAYDKSHHVFMKPWQDMHLPKIHHWTADERPTLQILLSFLDEVHAATPTQCGAPRRCKLRRDTETTMFLCELCREWLHKKCIGDMFISTEGANVSDETSNPYICPLHRPTFQDNTSKRACKAPQLLSL